MRLAPLVVWPLCACLPVSAGCERLQERFYSPRISVTCQAMDGRCQFINFGDPGELCVTVEVFHLRTGLTTVSEPVCSGRIGRDQPVERRSAFPGRNPLELCMGKDLKLDFKKECRVEILEVEGEGKE